MSVPRYIGIGQWGSAPINCQSWTFWKKFNRLHHTSPSHSHKYSLISSDRETEIPGIQVTVSIKSDRGTHISIHACHIFRSGLPFNQKRLWISVRTDWIWRTNIRIQFPVSDSLYRIYFKFKSNMNISSREYYYIVIWPPVNMSTNQSLMFVVGVIELTINRKSEYACRIGQWSLWILYFFIKLQRAIIKELYFFE